MDLSEKIRALYAIVNDLETAYPGRRFTLDGHMIGSIGEVIAAEAFGLNLLPNSTPEHDAIAYDGRLHLQRQVFREINHRELRVDVSTNNSKSSK